MPTTNQVKQASDAIKNAGYEPTPALIERVIDEKVRDGRASYATATDRALKGTQTDSNAPTGTAPTGSNQGIENSLEATTQALADSLKQSIVSEALNRVVADLKAGDFGTFVNVPLGKQGALDVNFTEVLDSKPYRALSPATPTNSLPLLNASVEDSND